MGGATTGRPARIASALDIMLEGPIGAAAFNNEFGRPNILGYFRTLRAARRRRRGGARARLSQADHDRGRPRQRPRACTWRSATCPPGATLVVLGGPAMLIGLGGGAASSLGSGAGSEDLDFASVQRDNPEIQRRAQEVIDAAGRSATDNPDPADPRRRRRRAVERAARARRRSQRGGRIDLRDVPTTSRACRRSRSGATRRRSATCSRSSPGRLDAFAALCERERCPVRGRRRGHATTAGCVVDDAQLGDRAVDLPLEVLLGKPPKMLRDVRAAPRAAATASTRGASTSREALERVLRLPTVADKTFLITIGDRTVGGLIAAIRWSGRGRCRSATSRSPPRLRGAHRRSDGDGRAHAARAARRAGLGAHGGRRGDHQHRGRRRARDSATCKLSANWMAACGEPGEDADLLRRRARGRRGALSGARHRDSGRQGLAVDAHRAGTTRRRRARGRRAAVAHRLRVCAGARRAPHADAGSSTRRGAERRCCSSISAPAAIASAARASRRCYGALGDAAPDRRRPRAARGVLRRDPRAARRGPRARVSRSLRRRAASRCSRWRSPAAAGSTSISARSSDPLAALVQRGARRACCRCATRDLDRSRGRCSRGTASARSRADRHGHGRASASASRRPGRRPARRDRARAARAVVGDELAHAAAARQSGVRGRGVRARARRRTIPGSPAARRSIRGRGHRGAVHRDRRAAARRDPARAGRQQPGRDGGGLRPRRLRAGRRAHDRPARPAARRSTDFAGLVACGGFSYGDVLGAGEGWAKSILFNRARARACSRPSSRATDSSRSASATAARCCPRCAS